MPVCLRALFYFKSIHNIAFGIMVSSMRAKRRVLWGSMLVLWVPVLFVGTAFSARFTSTSYVIDASINDSFGGQSSSTNYKAVTSGGDSIIGNGSGGSYKIGAGFVSQLERGMQLTVQPGGLKAAYNFDEPAGLTILDGSSNANNGQIGATGGRTAGKIGSALAVNGAATDSQVPDNAALPTGSAMTIELWAKQTSVATNEALVSQWDYTGALPVSGGWALQTSNTDASRLRFYVATGAADPGNTFIDTQVNSWTTGVWHHVAIVFDGSQAASNRVAAYIDGSPQVVSIQGTLPASILDANAKLDIGDFYGLNRPLHGSVDEVKLFGRALSAAEIKAEYDAQNAGIATGVHLGSVLPGASNTALLDAIAQTDAAGYSLAISQNQDLTSGGNTIPAVSGSIASPVSWSEGTTKGLGFTLVGTNATAIPAKWNSGASYAALPSASTSFYTRTGYGAGAKDYVNMRLRLDVPTMQAPASYQNMVTLTGTMLP